MNIVGWVYDQLIADTALVTALGSAGQIVREYPDEIMQTPVLAFLESNNRDSSWYDNQALSADSAIDIHVFTDFGTSTSAISELVSALMASLLYTRDYQADMDDPSQKLRHKVLKFSRDNIVPENIA